MSTKIKSFATLLVALVTAELAIAQNTSQPCPQNTPPESWNNCVGQLRDSVDGSFYSGGFSRGQYHGPGILITRQGTYTGDFKSGRFDGQGVLTFQDGRYIGDFRNGDMEGQGRIVSADGSVVFIGAFVAGQPVQVAPQAQKTPRQPTPSGQAPQPQTAPQAAQRQQPGRQTAQPPTVANTNQGKLIIPSRQWDCSTGYSPYVSYSSLVTSGSTYTTSWRDGSNPVKGTYSWGSSKTAYGGASVQWDSGAWSSFQGEYLPAGSINPRTGKPEASDSIMVGKDSSYWSTVCYPK